MDAAADAVILCITKIYRACPARRLKGQEPRRERKREREDGKRGQGQGRTNVYYVRYSKTEKRDGGGREREKCVRTVIAMQWEQHAEQHNGGEGGPSLPALLLSPLDFVTLSGHGAVCVAFGHFRRGRAHLRCTYVRMSSETAVLEPPTQSRQRWLLRCPRGSKRPVCVASRPRVVGAGVIYPMDIYILLPCRATSWLLRWSHPSLSLSPLVRRRRQTTKATTNERDATAWHSSS